MLHIDMWCLFTQRMHPSMPIEPYMSAHGGGGGIKGTTMYKQTWPIHTHTYMSGLNMPRLNYNNIVGFKMFYLNYLY